MRTSFARFIKDESGATAIEYGLIAAGIAVAIITAVNAVGTDLYEPVRPGLCQAHRGRQVSLQNRGSSSAAMRGWTRFSIYCMTQRAQLSRALAPNPP